MNAVHGQNEAATAILAAVRERFGISFTETQTGGGCMALEARLESGHWIVATDENLMAFVSRIAHEAELDADDERRPMGWSIGIYPNNTEHGCDWWGGEETVVDVIDYDAFADALPDMVGRALDDLTAVVR